MMRHDLYKRGRGYAITCLTFGKSRKEEFPDHFFCHACDMLEDAVLNNTTNRWKPSREMKKYVCTGGHCAGDVSSPTTLKNGYRPPNVPPQHSTRQIGGDEDKEENSRTRIGGCTISNNSEEDNKGIKKSSTQRIGNPTKKKLRRHALKCGGDIALQEEGVDGGSSSNDEDGLIDCLPRPNRLFSYGCNQETIGDKGDEITMQHFPMAASITPEEPAECRMVTTEAELSSYIDALEEMNAQLNERVAELNSSNVDLVVMVDALNSEIAQLKVEQNNKDRVAAAVDTLGYVENITLNNEEGICDNEQENVERTQRKRIRVENSELACELALLISNFTSSSVFSIVEPTKVPAKSTCKDCR